MPPILWKAAREWPHCSEDGSPLHRSGFNPKTLRPHRAKLIVAVVQQMLLPFSHQRTAPFQ